MSPMDGAAVSDAIIQATDALGWVGIFTVMLFTAPEVVLPFLGYVVYRGEADPLSVFSAASLGATLGSTLIYLAIRGVGGERVRAWVRRGSRWHLIEEGDLARVDAAFLRYGRSIVFFGRWVPTVRSLVSVPAGVLPMRLAPFLVYTFLGTALWHGVLFGAGYLTGSSWDRLEAYLGTYGTVATTLATAAAVGFVLLRLRNRVLRK